MVADGASLGEGFARREHLPMPQPSGCGVADPGVDGPADEARLPLLRLEAVQIRDFQPT